MKVCFVGLGSIGRRHLKNFTTIASQRNQSITIHALRSSHVNLPDNYEKMIDQSFFHESTLDDDYDISFICTPTNQHQKSIASLAKRSQHLFIEKPLFETTCYSLDDLNLKSHGHYYVTCPLRHTKVFKAIQSYVQNKQIYSARAICSSYLPDWREGIDYRTSYSAKKSEGGGVAIDLIHEWDYLTALFGFPIKCYSLLDQVSNLEIDSEDIALYLAKYTDKLVEVHLDYFGRKPIRQLQLFCEKKTILADFYKGTISWDDSSYSFVDYLPENANDKYICEMNYFLDLCLGNQKQNCNTLDQAYQLLQFVLSLSTCHKE